MGRRWEKAQSAFHENSLASIVERCSASETLEAGAKFIGMINKLQFKAKIER
jgi:hypothetical protein